MVVEKSPILFIASLQSLMFTLSGVFSLPKASASVNTPGGKFMFGCFSFSIQ